MQFECVEVTWPATQQMHRRQELTSETAYRLREGEASFSEIKLPCLRFRRAYHTEHTDKVRGFLICRVFFTKEERNESWYFPSLLIVKPLSRLKKFEAVAVG